MNESETYVRIDEHGVRRVAGSRVMLDSIVASFEQGYSPEAIRQQYSALTLEEVYGAITYYLSHRDDVEGYLKQQGKVWNHWRAKVGESGSPFVERLRGLAKADVRDDG